MTQEDTQPQPQPQPITFVQVAPTPEFQPIKRFVDSVWFKIISICLAGLFTITSGYGVYHLNKLDDIVRSVQRDKIELIDRINEIDNVREDDIKEVKKVMNEINVNLEAFIARTEASRFTADDGLEVWREIATIKQEIVSMQKDINRNAND